ncbi:uncharacterized protein LOC131656653 [Vicia villosa]|uniref:uncharacterized protein LOC131656653 n=1 Tax=Vicia villosa TaxID=3911 RepID=UPI00273C1A79|nr:uncharacterized protein LOC131656653 [Vicia villosa]
MAHNFSSLSEDQFSRDDEIVELSQLGREEDEESVDLSPQVLKDDDIKEFQKKVMANKWGKVIENYKADNKYHTVEIKGRGTALHVAVNVAPKHVVQDLINAIEKHDDNSGSVKIRNEIGDTPLHLAAYRGLTDMCEAIIGKKGERKALIREKNKKGETPLFCAVCAHKSLVFLYLKQFYPRDLEIAVDGKQTSILHVAIQREMFDLANIIMHCYKELITKKDKHGNVPLAILATRTSAFKSGSSLPWWKNIVYYCVPIIHNDEITILESFLNKDENKEKENEKKDKGCDDICINLCLRRKSVSELKGKDKIQHPSSVTTLEEYYGIKISKKYVRPSKESELAWTGLSILGLKEIRTIKMKHKYGDLLFKQFLKTDVHSYMGYDDDQDGNKKTDHNLKSEALKNQDYPERQQKRGDTTTQKTKENKKIDDSENIDGEDTTLIAIVKSGFKEIMDGLDSTVPITSDKRGLLLAAMNYIKTGGKSDVNDYSYLIAASNGITEMVEKLQEIIPSVVFETNSNNENVLLLAVKNRQPRVIQMLTKKLLPEVFDHLSLQFDKNENTMLHWAAYTSFQRENTWRIPGVALQMMWDIKWYKYIKELVPEHFSNRTNEDKKTPSEIFKEHHKELLEKSVDWLRDTAESCSVVAALIAGVSFSTSGSVPGGNQQSGEPTLAGQPAFEGFAISSLIGLYFSVTALIMFLSILTSRKEIDDFRLNLPMKLLFGLSSLFVSIVSMYISFSAGHFFVLSDKYTNGGILFYLYISISIPVAFYAVVQFPLFLDLVNVIWKMVPPSSFKGVLL